MTDKQKRARVRRPKQITDLQEFAVHTAEGWTDEPLTREEIEAVERLGKGKLWPATLGE